MSGFQHQRGCPVTYARDEWRYFWGPQTCTCPDNPTNEETSMTDQTETLHTRLRRIRDSIKLGMSCDIRIGSEGRGLFVQIRCYRMDVITKKMGYGFGGKAYPSEYATDSEIIQMIFGLYKGYWEHEARETFELRNEEGEYRRPFGPHIDTWALWSVARRVDVRSAKHVEDRDDFPKDHPEIDPMDEYDLSSGGK